MVPLTTTCFSKKEPAASVVGTSNIIFCAPVTVKGISSFEKTFGR
jgi:hypothetical protein